MTNKKYKIGAFSAFILLLLMVFTVVAAYADDFTVDMHGNYAHPKSGVIEDSGGESSSALGQSMVERIISQKGFLQTNVNNQNYISFSFGLMNSISDVTFLTQQENENSWSNAQYEITKGDDTADFRVQIPSESVVIKAKCFIEPMGRAVVFFIHFDNKVSGNLTQFLAVEQKQEDVPKVPKVTENKAENITPQEKPKTEKQTNSTNILDDATGIIVGKSDKVDDNNKENLPLNNNQMVLDDSFWMTIFMLFVTANLVSGVILILFNKAIKHMSKQRELKKQQLKAIFNQKTKTLDLNHINHNDIEIWGEDDETNN